MVHEQCVLGKADWLPNEAVCKRSAVMPAVGCLTTEPPDWI